MGLHVVQAQIAHIHVVVVVGRIDGTFGGSAVRQVSPGGCS